VRAERRLFPPRSNPLPRHRRWRGSVSGFTLLEVLVALLVLALALLALSRTAANQVDAFGAMRERTIAGWLAADVLAQTRLATPFPATGTSDGRRRFGGRDWRYDVVVQGTPVASIRRIDVHVYAPDDPKSPIATLTGFGGLDLQP
jgi:general secretion pathway protein I